MDHPPHILNGASNLIAIALILVTSLRLTNLAQKSRADELAWAAAISLMASCIAAYAGMWGNHRLGMRKAAHWLFSAGLGLLMAALLAAATGIDLPNL